MQIWVPSLFLPGTVDFWEGTFLRDHHLHLWLLDSLQIWVSGTFTKICMVGKMSVYLAVTINEFNAENPILLFKFRVYKKIKIS